MLQIRRYLYWWGLRRQARAYIKANNLRAVASAMFELDRHARLGDQRCAICRLRGALIEVLYRQGRCVQCALPAGPPEGSPGAGADEPGGACARERTALFTFLVEGRRYTWRQPLRALGFAPRALDLLGERREACAQALCLRPACRDALMAVVYEYVRRQGSVPPVADCLPALRPARALAALDTGGHWHDNCRAVAAHRAPLGKGTCGHGRSRAGVAVALQPTASPLQPARR